MDMLHYLGYYTAVNAAYDEDMSIVT